MLTPKTPPSKTLFPPDSGNLDRPHPCVLCGAPTVSRQEIVFDTPERRRAMRLPDLAKAAMLPCCATCAAPRDMATMLRLAAALEVIVEAAGDDSHFVALNLRAGLGKAGVFFVLEGGG